MRIDPRRRGRQSGPERRDACFSPLIYLHEYYSRLSIQRFHEYFYRGETTDKRGSSRVNTFRKQRFARLCANCGRWLAIVASFRLIKNSKHVFEVGTTRALSASVDSFLRGWCTRDALWKIGMNGDLNWETCARPRN